MIGKISRYTYWATTCLWAFMALLFSGVLLKSFGYDAVDMWVNYGPHRRESGNMVGLLCGFAAYAIFLLFLILPKVRHNLNWFMHFTHELTHTLVALLFFRRIEEFLVSRRDCHVKYQKSRIGYIPITLSPYCIPVFTFMLFPFRFAGDSHYMIIFDALIAFTYAFHVHAFIKQTRFSQPDIEGCGPARSTTFIAFVHACVLSLILATPRGGVMNAIKRVFWEYPMDILTDPSGWFHEVIRYF